MSNHKSWCPHSESCICGKDQTDMVEKYQGRITDRENIQEVLALIEAWGAMDDFQFAHYERLKELIKQL